MKTLALGLSLLLLSGCAAQRYELPAQDVLTQSQIEERYSIDRQWWKQYGDPKLDALVEAALERNIDLARSAVSVNRALYRARQLGADGDLIRNIILFSVLIYEAKIVEKHTRCAVFFKK